jgi:hypothetical protein
MTMSQVISELRLTNNSQKRRVIRAIQFAEFVLLFSLLLPASSRAIIVGKGQFAQLIENAEIIVKARIIQINEPPFEMIAFKADVITILEGDSNQIPNQLLLEAPTPIWPKDLGAPYAEKQVVLLVLHREDGKLTVVNNLRAILPSTDIKIYYDNRCSVTRKVFDELHAYLPQVGISKVTEKLPSFLPQGDSEFEKALVLVHLSQLASKEDENMFLPYMESTDEWLKRAALASLLRINPTSERAQAAMADFYNHLSNLSKPLEDNLFWQMYTDVQWAARCGAFGMEKNLTTRAKACIPIYRVLIDKAPPDYQMVYIAIEALKNVGTREDIKRLYKYLDHEKAWIRHDVLEGLGRILGMKVRRPEIISYEIPEKLPYNVKAWEKETRSAIEKVLANKGLLMK